jgi:uncharacterized protein YhhL (DUF1145 family)
MQSETLMFYTLNKLGALVFYAATLASFFVPLPVSAEVVHWMRLIAGALLVAHVGEAVIFRRQVALYPGPMAVSVLLTLLFGFLHWKPLADKARR